MRHAQQRSRQRLAYKEVVQSLRRRQDQGAPLRDVFYRYEVDGEARYPLAQLMSSRSGPGGGRGGRTRVALYLSLLWVAAQPPHSSRRPASFWASLLGLPDPDNASARAIRSTWAELAARGLVDLTPGTHSGDVPTVQALREDGSGEPYTIPAGRGGDTYRRIPQSVWRMLLPQEDLTGAGLAMYLVAVRTAFQASSASGLTFPAKAFRAQYGLSDSTRKAGLANLTDLLVLDAHRHSTVDDRGGIGGRRRQRNTYDLLDEYVPDLRPTDARASNLTIDPMAGTQAQAGEASV